MKASHLAMNNTIRNPLCQGNTLQASSPVGGLNTEYFINSSRTALCMRKSNCWSDIVGKMKKKLKS